MRLVKCLTRVRSASIRPGGRRVLALVVATVMAIASGIVPETPGRVMSALAASSLRQDSPGDSTGSYTGEAIFDFANLPPYTLDCEGTLSTAPNVTGIFNATSPPGQQFQPWRIYDMFGTVDASGHLSGTVRMMIPLPIWPPQLPNGLEGTFQGTLDGGALMIVIRTPETSYPPQDGQIGGTFSACEVTLNLSNELGDCELEKPSSNLTLLFDVEGGNKGIVVEPTPEECGSGIIVDGEEVPDWIEVSRLPSFGYVFKVKPITSEIDCKGREAKYFIRTLRSERVITIDQYPQGSSAICSACPTKSASGLLSGGAESLRLARRFRDEVMARSEHGAESTRLYYRFADEASAILESNPLLLVRAARLLDRVTPVLRSILEGGQATIAEADLAEADALFADVAACASPDFKRAIARARLDLASPDRREEYGLRVASPALARTSTRGHVARSDDLLFTTFAGLGRLRPPQVLAAAAHARVYIQAVRQHADELPRLLAANPWLALQAPGIRSRLESVIESVIFSGSATIDVPAREELDAFLAGLEPSASPELRQSLVSLRRDLRDPRALEGLGVRASRTPNDTQSRATSAYDVLPLAFVTLPGSKYTAHGLGYGLSVSPTELGLSLRPNARGARAGADVRLRLIGADPAAKVTASGAVAGTRNFFLGNRPGGWLSEVKAWSHVTCSAVYQGVDLVCYGSQRSLEYDFCVAPGADPNAILLRVDGADRVHVDEHGDLVIETATGEVRNRRPVVYQDVDGDRRAVESGYRIGENGQIGFWLGSYDRGRPLVIDPVLDYSSYLGGSDSDTTAQIAVDASGSTYLTGSTAGAGFPATGGTYGGGDTDAFVVKLNPEGTAVVYATYIGGSGEDDGVGLAVDASGNAYVAGSTTSVNFPVRSGLQPTLRGTRDAFLARLDASGSALTLSTYLGGSDEDVATGVAVSPKAIFVSGISESEDFPTSKKGMSRTLKGETDGFVVQFKKKGAKMGYSTFIGGGGFEMTAGIAVDAAGNAYVAGVTTSSDLPTTSPAQATFGGQFDGFVMKLNPKGTASIYSTFLGGSDLDGVAGIAVDAAGNAYVAGVTASRDFPLANPVQASYGGGLLDGFVAKVKPDGTGLVYSTYLGGSDEDRAYRVMVDQAGRAHTTGLTASQDFPVRDPVQEQHNGDGFDAFVTTVAPAGSSLVFSTYLGGSADDSGSALAVDPGGMLFLVGDTTSTDFPVTGSLQMTNRGGFDAFIVRLTVAEARSSPATPGRR